jgi:hypothetical protein
MMRVAYIISAYKNPEQLTRLITKLSSERAVFFVHVDKKAAKEEYCQIAGSTSRFANVRFLRRHRCYWGGFGHVEATLEGIKELVEQDVQYEYAFLLTGQDYPIKTNAQIQAFLLDNMGRSFLENFPLPSENWENGGLQRVESWYFHWYGRRFVLPRKSNSFIKRRFPGGLRPFGGSSYWCLTSECIAYLYQFVRRHPSFVTFFKYVDVPDEIFFQTILMNSLLADSIVNDDLRYIEWKDPNSGSPSVLDKSDFDKIASSPKLFARKFDTHVDAEILDLIDQRILHCVSAEAGKV